MKVERVYFLRFWPKGGLQVLKTNAAGIASAKANNYIQVSDTFWKKTVYKWEHERHIAELQNNLRKS